MRKFAALPLALVLLAAVPRAGHALVLTHVLTTYESPADVLFDSRLGTLTSVSLEIRFQTGVIYETPYYDGTLGTVHPFDITFSGDAPFVVFDDVGYRDRTFSWIMPGHGEGGSGSPFYSAAGSGPSIQTHTAADILDFFTFHEGDQGMSFYGWNDWISCSPEVIYDSRFNPYLYYNAKTNFGDGVVLTYNYESLAPVPEAGSALFLGMGAALLLSSRLISPRRRAGLRKR